MVNAQAVHFALRNQFKNQTVRRLEYALVFHANASKIVGIEKTPVVDVVGSDSPVGQAIRLSFDEFVKFVETGGIVWPSIEKSNGCVNALDDFRRSSAQFGETALVDLLISIA